MKDQPIAQQIDDIIQKNGGWKAGVLSKLRETILHADTNISEEIKWRMATRPEGLPVWTSDGIICFAEIWKDNVKLLFPKGALLQNNADLFNARLKSASVRAIEYREGDIVDGPSLKKLVVEAVALNRKDHKKGSQWITENL